MEDQVAPIPFTQIKKTENEIIQKTDLDDFPLHECIFNGDHRKLASLLQNCRHTDEEITKKDKHGNTPLHLSVMLGRKECIDLLLLNGAPVNVKNLGGWSPLAEAISYGDRKIICKLFCKLKQQSRRQIDERRSNLIKTLYQMQDFYMELKWDFNSWLPLASRILPSDICKIHKCGSSIRLDTTLVDFTDMHWERGDISFLFRGDEQPNESLTVLDNEFQCYQHVRYEENNIEDEVDVLMSTDIHTAQMSTKDINFVRAKSGWLFREDRKELVSDKYQCDLYIINGLVLKSRKRREHLSFGDIQKNKAVVESITTGKRSTLIKDIDSNCGSIGSLNRRCSLQPPPETTVKWEQYLSAPPGKCPKLGREPMDKQTIKCLRATVAMSQNFPLSVEMLLNVLEVITPFKHFNKLREFVTLKLPSGFPVKIEIPVLTMVSAKITFQKFEFRENMNEKLFEVPSHYVEDSRRFPDL